MYVADYLNYTTTFKVNDHDLRWINKEMLKVVLERQLYYTSDILNCILLIEFSRIVH